MAFTGNYFFTSDIYTQINLSSIHSKPAPMRFSAPPYPADKGKGAIVAYDPVAVLSCVRVDVA